MWTEDVSHAVLDNGLTVIVRRDSAAPVLSVVTHVRAGYLDEPDSWVGISHVLEHMYFKVGSLADEVQQLGGYVNAGTIYDKTVYYAVLPSAPGTLETAVRLQARTLIDFHIDAAELARELEVIIQEANRKKDAPLAVAVETLYAQLYGQHRIRRWRIGTEDELRRLRRDDLLGFYGTCYTPERTIVGIVGDIDADNALEVAAREFGTWSVEALPSTDQPGETRSPPPAMRLLHGDVNRVIAVMGWRSPGGLLADVAALDMGAAVLGAGKGSLLSREIREPGLASSASAHNYTLHDVGVFELFLEGGTAGTDPAIERALEIVSAVGSTPVSDDDLECARALTATRWSRRLESMDGQASMLCEFEALGGYRLMDDWYRQLMDVSADQVSEAVRRLLDVSQSALVVYAPNGTTSRYHTAGWPPNVTPRSFDAVPIPASPFRTDGPSAASRRSFPDGTELVALPGADLLVKSKPGTGLAFLGVYAESLRGLESPSQTGLSSLLLRSSLRGIAALSSTEVSRLAESFGGSIAPSMLLGWVGWGLNVRVDSIDDAAALLLHIAQTPQLAERDVETERALQVSDAARARDDMSGYPMRRVLEIGLPGSWYGKPALGEPEQLEMLGVDDVRAWHGRLRKRRLAVILVGDADVDELVRQGAAFAAWPSAERNPEPDDLFPWSPAREIESRQKAQTALAMAFPAGSYHSADRYPLMVCASILSGLAGRLFIELRDRLSLAYSVSASAWFRQRAGALLTYIATSPAREAEAREQMLESLMRFVRDGPSHDEFGRAKNYTAGQVQLRRQSTYAVASDVISAWVCDDLEGLERTAENIQAVTLEDVMEVAARVIVPEGRAEFTLRGGDDRPDV